MLAWFPTCKTYESNFVNASITSLMGAGPIKCKVGFILWQRLIHLAYELNDLMLLLPPL